MKNIKRILIFVFALSLITILTATTVSAMTEDDWRRRNSQNLRFHNPEGQDVQTGGGRWGSAGGCSWIGGLSENTNYRGDQVFSDVQLQRIAENQPFYEQAANLIPGLPWQLLAVIHLRESSLGRWNPRNCQGIFQLYSYTGGGDCSRFPEGEVDNQGFQEQLNLLVEHVLRSMINGESNAGRMNSDPNQWTDRDVKALLFRFNGRAQVYIQQARNLGFSEEEAQVGEGSPYVMNRADLIRDPTQEPTRSNNTWGQIRVDRGPMVYPATNQIGAFVLFAVLMGGTEGGGGIVCDNLGHLDNEGFAFFLQADARWGNTPVGPSNIRTIGCFITSVAMAVSTLTGQNITPIETMRIHRENGGGWSANGSALGGTHGRLPRNVAISLGLSAVEIAPNSNAIGAINQALARGALIIAGGGGGSLPFNTSQHWVVIRGMQGGQWIVADPARGTGTDAYDQASMIVSGANLGSAWTIIERR
jgi:hypothetical protein